MSSLPDSSIKPMSGKDGKADVEKIAVASGAAMGGTTGAVAIGAATANITVATAATNASAAAAATAAASGPAIFAPFHLAGAAVFHPAAWAVALSNPIGAVAVVGGLTTFGGFLAYKGIKKALGD